VIYELRIYRCVSGRMPTLLSRFENETLRIWEKHGIRPLLRGSAISAGQRTTSDKCHLAKSFPLVLLLASELFYCAALQDWQSS
jgi:hypothetical protein